MNKKAFNTILETLSADQTFDICGVKKDGIQLRKHFKKYTYFRLEDLEVTQNRMQNDLQYSTKRISECFEHGQIDDAEQFFESAKIYRREIKVVEMLTNMVKAYERDTL